jgi:hypothetical protein
MSELASYRVGPAHSVPAAGGPVHSCDRRCARCRVGDAGHTRPRPSARHPREQEVCRLRLADLAAEQRAADYDHDGHPAGDTHHRAPDPTDEVDELPRELSRAIDRLCAIDVDALTDAALRDHLARLRQPLARLTALRARWPATLETRTIASAPPQGRRAAQREARREVAEAQQLTPAEAKRAVEAGRAARRHPETGRAFLAGELSPDHVRVIDELLAAVDDDDREGFEQRLLELARDRDATRFGREARSLLASLSPTGAATAERRKHGRRRVRATDTPDGGFAFSGLLYGTAAETARVALDAFCLPDVPGEHRTPEQRAADGFEQLCAAALRGGAAPTQHGARPQVLVIFDAEQLARHEGTDEPGVGRFGRSGHPVTTDEVGPLLDDSRLLRIVRDADRAPIEVSEAVRTVPAGLWRALLVRDGGCTWPGCDAPAAWCDVAHGHTPFVQHGRLSPDNAALLCRRHHRRFDHGPWRMVVASDTVTYHRTDLSPERARGPGPPPPEASWDDARGRSAMALFSERPDDASSVDCGPGSGAGPANIRAP